MEARFHDVLAVMQDLHDIQAFLLGDKTNADIIP
jgi:hypothetical protein